MPSISFISAPFCLAAAAGLVTLLRPCLDDHIVPFLCLRHAPKLPHPRVDLIYIAPRQPPPTAIGCCCVGSSELERAALEV